MTEIKFEIIKRIGVLSKSGSGWEKQLNLVSWNDREAKDDIGDSCRRCGEWRLVGAFAHDLREWSPDGVKMGKDRRFLAPIQPMAARSRLG